MRAGELLSRAQFGEYSLYVLDRAAHPFQFGVLEFLPDECRAHLVVAKDGAVVALGGFVQFDLVVLDGGGLELLGDALLYVARRLPNLEKALVRLVVNRIGVDARPSFWLRREYFLDRSYSSSPPSRFIEVPDNAFSMKAISPAVMPYFLYRVLVRPLPRPLLLRYERVDLTRGVCGWFMQENQEARDSRQER